MKKIISTSVAAFTLLCATHSAMANRTENEAYAIANKALSNANKILLTGVNTNGSDTLYYTFKSSTGGYAIVSAKEQTPALLAYNKQQDMNEKEVAHLEEFLSTYFQNLDHLQLKRNTQNNSNGLKLSKLTGCAIAPLLGDIAWGQEEPFNQYSPTISGTVAPTGCVATAIAQLLYYYKYPAAVQSDIPGYTSTTNKIAIKGVSKGTKLDWENMLDTYNDGFSTANTEAVSQLMIVVGVAGQMDYKEDASSSGMPGVVELPLYFGYDADLIKRVYRSTHTLEEWYEIIYNELKEKRPVLMSGSTMKTGHRFICDGIDENGMFHVNWGWDGRHNGYYDLTILNPNTTSETGASTSKDGYTKENNIIIGITPDNGKKDARTSTNVSSVSVKHQITNGYNYLFYTYANPYSTKETVYLASGYVDDNGEVVLVGSKSSNDLEAATSYEQQNAMSLQTSTFKEGKFYKVGLMESLDGNTWTPCEGYENVSVTFTVKNGKVVVASESKLSAELTITDYNKVGTYSYGVIDLKNDGNKEYLGVVYLMTNSVNENPMKYSFAATVTVEAANTNQMEVTFIPKSDTTYYWIMDNETKLIKSGLVVKGNETYKLSATVKLDTLSNGTIMCRLNVTNTGKSLYIGNIESTLFHTEGSVTNHQENVIVKAGASIELNFEVNKELSFTNYIITDDRTETITSGQFTTNSTNGKTTLYNNYSPFASKGDTVKGFVTITNFSQNQLEGTLRITISKNEDGEQTEIYNQEISVMSDNFGIFNYETTAPADSFYFHIFVNDQEITAEQCKPTLAAMVLAKPIQDISIEVMGQTLVVTAHANTELTIFNATGNCIAYKPMVDGETLYKTLQRGIYVVNGKKVRIQ